MHIGRYAITILARVSCTLFAVKNVLSLIISLLILGPFCLQHHLVEWYNDPKLRAPNCLNLNSGKFEIFSNARLTLCDFFRQDFCRPSERRNTKILRPLTLYDCTRQPRSHYATNVFRRWHPGHGDPGRLVKTKQCNSTLSIINKILVMAPFTKQTLLTITAQ